MMTFDDWWFKTWDDDYNMAACTVLMKADNVKAIHWAEDLYKAGFQAGVGSVKDKDYDV